MNTKDTLKKYSSILIIAFIIIVLYKTFNTSIFDALFNAFLPLIIGGVLAYFLQPLVNILETKLDNSTNHFILNHSHTISVLLVFLGFILSIIIILIYLIPMIAQYGINFIQNVNTYVKDYESSIRSIFGNSDITNILINFEQTLVASFKKVNYVDVATIFSTVSKTGGVLLKILLGLIFAPYIMIEAKKLVRIFDRFISLFTNQYNIDLIHHYTYQSHQIFGKFIYGKFIDSLIIGLIALVGFGVMKLSYFPLLAVIILVTNMIPYFGPFIGAVPVIFIALLTEGIMPGVTSMIFIFALQQFDGLFLGPRILGDTVGISPFWIICSITVFGSLFGFLGMFLGVPLICVIRMFFNDFINYRKNRKSEPQ